MSYITRILGSDGSVGIATRYVLEGPGIETRWGDISRTRPDRPWDPLSLLQNEYRVSLPGVKRPGRGVEHPPPSSAEIQETVELYLYSPSGPSWPVTGWPLPLGFIIRIIRSKEMRWAGHLARNGRDSNACADLVRKHEGRHRCRWEDNTKMHLKEIDGRVWTGLICVGIQTAGWFSRTQ